MDVRPGCGIEHKGIALVVLQVEFKSRTLGAGHLLQPVDRQELPVLVLGFVGRIPIEEPEQGIEMFTAGAVVFEVRTITVVLDDLTTVGLHPHPMSAAEVQDFGLVEPARALGGQFRRVLVHEGLAELTFGG